ncbi:30S ribosome-binding factor RbfA [Planctomicrobium piriforme]|uniref:Ribosome-binding factor A n=1 Tax=Planctomicrobium piriforme TaxID=1576369 RepID=A0A1I3D3T7_9PLAN|nr:30S ribosome-binding factor RbfA [Planctomicrobium piriforme]SFH81357.1 ribosome-binding factor A [Planctomicrobium piriforme]
MATRRTAKVAAAVRQVVSNAILFGLRDPRVVGVTVLTVEVPPDLRTAKVFISILGDEKTARLTMKGLEAARGYIQSKIADELDLRLTPVLTFVVDPGIKKSIEISKMLRELDLPADGESTPATEDEVLAGEELAADEEDDSEEE